MIKKKSIKLLLCLEQAGVTASVVDHTYTDRCIAVASKQLEKLVHIQYPLSFSSVFGLHHHLRKISVFLAAKLSTVFTS